MNDRKTLCGLILILGVAAACSSGNDDSADAGATVDAGAGGSAAGGTGGALVGSGGSPQTGGLGGGGMVAGGAGGVQTGGAGGGGPGQGGAAGGGGAAVPSLDACFTALRAGEGSYQVATKASADMKYRMRLALETADRFGTSGTRAWGAYRVALQTPEGNVCVSDENALASAYQGSRHNCSDKLTVTMGNKRYVIDNPDSAIDIVDPSTWVRPATLTIFVNNQMVGAPIRLDTVACHASSGTPVQCRSGGPC